MSLFKKRTATPAPAKEQTGERRQLTVLFYDIVGSTTLVEANDAEALRGALDLIHEEARHALERHGGSLQQVMGDGGMAYFGFPIANEDAALAAVMAALDLLEARSEIAGAPNIRIGIATSVVVLPDDPGAVSGARLGAVGVAPNLAARLESAAGVNQILVGPLTYTLTQKGVEYRAQDGLSLKGFPDVTRAWRPTALRPTASRFERDRDGSGTFTGRALEIQTLTQAWATTQAGQGTALLIEGEPGIGKSRMVAELTRSAKDDRVVLLQCQPRTSGDALFCVIAMYERAYEDASDPVLVHAAERTAEQLGVLEDDDTLSADARRDAILKAVIQELTEVSQDRPLLVMVEDLHWADEVTLALLERLAAQASRTQMLVVATSRPDENLQDIREIFRTVPLAPIGAEDAAQLTKHLARTDLTEETVDWIVARGDGNPLFLTELTAFAAETLAVGKTLADIEGTALETLSALLTTRLDRAGVAKRTAQIASVFGREYPRHVLAELSASVGMSELDADLHRLVDCGLQDVISNGYSYAFRHALIRDAAYDSQLVSVRTRLHAKIVDLVDANTTIAQSVPKILLAEHCLAAGRTERGTELLLDVAEDAIRRSALRAPRTMLTRVLTLSGQLAEGSARDVIQLRAISLLGPLVTLLDSPRAAAPLYQQGQALYFGLPDAARAAFFPVLWGWWFTASDLQEQTRRSEVLIRDVTPQADPESRLQALHCGWATLFDGGAHDRCLSTISDGLALYDPELGHRSRYLYGHDAQVCGLGERALCGWLTGQLDLSRDAIKSCETWADETAHLSSQLHGLDIASQVAVFNQDMAEIDRILTKMQRLSDTSAVPTIAAKRQIFRGWMAARAGDTGQIQAVTEGLSALRGFGVLEDVPFYADIAADVTAASGDSAAALGPLDDAISEARSTGLTYWLPELLRRRAILTQGAGADAFLDEGFAIAQSQNAQMLGLRNLAARLDLGLGVPAEHRAVMLDKIDAISICDVRQKVWNALAK